MGDRLGQVEQVPLVPEAARAARRRPRPGDVVLLGDAASTASRCSASPGSATPTRRAAVSGASGSRQPHALVRRADVAGEAAYLVQVPGSLGPTPVWAGLTHGEPPAACSTTARAAVMTVLPTPVSVPVTKMTAWRLHSRPSEHRRWPPRAPSSVRCACAVSRSLEIPSGVDGGRKQPIRTPCAGGASRPRRRASCGPGHRRPRGPRRRAASTPQACAQQGASVADPGHARRLVLRPRRAPRARHRPPRARGRCRR